MILRNFPCIVAEPIKRPVCVFPATAGIGVENKFLIEIRIQDSVNSVMKEVTSHGCFMYIARLRIIDAERCVSAVAVSFLGKVATKGNNIIGKPNGEFFDVFAAALAFEEFAPCYKQVFHRNDIIIGMKKSGISSLSLSRWRLDSPENQRGIFAVGKYCSSYFQRHSLYDRF